VTARCAADQGRDVFAVPGNVTSKNSWTPNTLIKQGAQLTATWEDVWETLSSQVRLEWVRRGGRLNPNRKLVHLYSRAGYELWSRGQRGGRFGVLRRDAALQMDEILEKVEAQLSSLRSLRRF
jgi:DNA processing protein